MKVGKPQVGISSSKVCAISGLGGSRGESFVDMGLQRTLVAARSRNGNLDQPPSSLGEGATLEMDLFPKGLVLRVDSRELLLERGVDVVDVFHGSFSKSPLARHL